MGVRNFSGSLWHTGSIRTIIVSPLYLGVRLWGRRQWVTVEDEVGNQFKCLKMTPDRAAKAAHCLALVPPEMWEGANTSLKRNQIAAMAHAKNAYLLRGLIFCETCGHRYTGAGDRYRCIGRHCHTRLARANAEEGLLPPCPAPSVKRAELEEAVWDEVATFLAQPGAVLQQLENQMLAVAGQKRNVGDDIRELEGQERRLKSKEDVVMEQLLEERIDRGQYIKAIDFLNAKRATIALRLRELRNVSAEQDANGHALAEARSLLDGLQQKANEKYFRSIRSAARSSRSWSGSISHRGSAESLQSAYATHFCHTANAG